VPKQNLYAQHKNVHNVADQDPKGYTAEKHHQVFESSYIIHKS